jgi:hypothetical protein
MSVKSTISLTRDEAEKKFNELYFRLNPHSLILSRYSDKELEDELEKMNDEVSYNGEGFENYKIQY